MEKIKNTANLSQAQARSMFKKYATSIVEMLRLSGIRMVKKVECHDYLGRFYWDSCITKKSRAKIHIEIDHEKANGNRIVWVNFIAQIDYQENHNETYLEKEVRTKTENTIDEKYPLSNLSISVLVEEQKIPNLNPEKSVARQLYLALKCHNKIYSTETIYRVKTVEKRINKLLEKETNVIVESFFH